LHHAKGSGAGPGHALKKSTAINAVMVVVMEDYVIIFFRHALLLWRSTPFFRRDLASQIAHEENLFVDLTCAAHGYSRVDVKNVKN
jgi:hypothetical protein